MNDWTRWIVMAQLASTWFMVGLIWFVQVVHYPLFAKVGAAGFQAYETDHQRFTTYVVAPVMLCELATAILLVANTPTQVPRWSAGLGLLLLAVIWGLTYAVQVPLHTQLAQQYSAADVQSLVAGNWWRTLAWSLRGLLVLWIVHRLLAAATVVGNDGMG